MIKIGWEGKDVAQNRDMCCVLVNMMKLQVA
jgi:hypothetical protein